MSRYKVYSKDGVTERCTLHKVEYNGSFMDSRVVTASISSPSPINFAIYDYIIYRGEKFEIDQVPTSVKNSSTGSSIESYSYDLTFVSLKYELERCEMRDLVPYDNGIVYATPLTIEFTGSADKLAERIQACLDAIYTGDQKWTINVVEGSSDEEKNISISQSNCWSAVSLFNTEYGLNFYISGRTITVGGSGTAIDFTFQYGKGNGLYRIERVTAEDTGVVTRLRAYGGTNNIGDNYLRDKNEWPDSKLPASMYLPNLMLPGFEETGVDYIESDNISEYGIREGSIVYEDIYPSITGMTNNQGQRIDKIRDAEQVSSESQNDFWITTYDLGFEKPLEDYIVTGGIPTVSIKTGTLQGYSFEINTDKIEKQSDGGYKLYLSRNTDNGFTVPNSDLNLSSGDEFVFLGITMPKAYIEAAEERLLARANEYLDKYSKTNFGYNIGLDEIFAARDSSIYESLYEGKKLRVLDSDLGINEEMIIQNLTITEEDGGIPVYKVTLNNEVSASTLNRIQGQVNQLESTVTNGFTLLKWQTEQYYKKLGRPYALWTRDGTTTWLYINEEGDLAILDGVLSVTGDVIAFADGGEYASGLPVADFDTFGLFKAKKNGGLLFDSNEGWYVDPEFAGGGGIDEEQLKQYLTDNNYITVDYLTEQGYLTLSSPLTGYTKPEAYSPIAATDTILSAIGKLERNFDNYVDLTTDQTIGGVKTFNETLLSKRDVIAYADGGEYASGLPVADQYTYGLVKVDGTTVRINASGQLEADSGGGINFTVGTGLDLSAASVLSVKFGTTSGTVCQGDDYRLSNARINPNSLSWSGYNSGSYDGGSSKSFVIPSNTNQLTNGAGFIYDADENIFSLVGSGNPSQYLAGNGRFYTISYTEISGLSDTFVKKAGDTMTGNLTINKSTPALYLSGSHTWQIYESGGDLGFKNNNVLAGYFSGSNNGNFVLEGTFTAKGDVIAYQDGGSYASGLPVADSSTYGLIKYDGTTIGKNSSGQLYVINAGSGGGSNINVIDSLTSQSKTDALSANQGYQLDQRLKKVRWGTPDGTDYVRTYLGNDYRDLSKNGHSHSNYLSSSNTYWGSSYANYASLKINGTSKNVSLNGHTHSNYLESSDIYSLTIQVNGSSVGTYNPASGPKTINISTSGGSSWNGGTISNGITISTSSAVGISIQTGRPFIKFGPYWEIRSGGDLNFYHDGGTAVAYFSGVNKGNLHLAGVLSQNSDMRLKTVVSPITDALKAISTFDVFRYKYNNDKLGRVRIGMSAQQVKIYYPELVFTESDGYYSMDYVSMSAVLVGGMQELYSRFLPVENKVKTLESRVQNLQLRLDNAYREIFELKQQKGGAA